MSHLERALQALKDSSDVQLKKLYLKKKPEAEKPKEEETLSDEDRELLEQLMKE